MSNPIFKRIAWFCIFAILLYAAFIIYSDANKNIQVLRNFPWRKMPLIIGAVMTNLLIRELKWDYYRRAAKIRVPRLGSFLVFFSGLSMTISPGRVGELIKPFMYKEYFGQKMRRSVPLVFCERISDLLGMILLAAVTVGAYMTGVGAARERTHISPDIIYGFLAISAIFMAFLIWFARQRRWVYAILIELGRRKSVSRLAHKMRRLYFETFPLLTLRNLGITTTLAFVSWSFECLALQWILHGVGAAEITFGEATFLFCMATVFGGFLFFLPGGLGGFEGSMTVMLGLLGVANFKAVPAIFITRFSTLFFSVALGFLFILLTSAKYHKRLMWEQFEHAGEELDQEVGENELGNQDGEGDGERQ